jgi:hypothetical protein
VKTLTAGPLRGAGAEGPRAPTINVKTSTIGPREVPELEMWRSKGRMSGAL